MTGKTKSVYLDDDVIAGMEKLKDENWSEVCNQLLKEYIEERLSEEASKKIVENDPQISFLAGIDDGKRAAKLMDGQTLKLWKDSLPNATPPEESWEDILTQNNKNPKEFNVYQYILGWGEGVKSVARTKIH